MNSARRRRLEFITNKFCIRDSSAILAQEECAKRAVADANVTTSLTAIARTIAIHRSLDRAIARKLNELCAEWTRTVPRN